VISMSDKNKKKQIRKPEVIIMPVFADDRIVDVYRINANKPKVKELFDYILRKINEDKYTCEEVVALAAIVYIDLMGKNLAICLKNHSPEECYITLSAIHNTNLKIIVDYAYELINKQLGDIDEQKAGYIQ